MFSLTVYLTALLYIGSQFAVLKLKKRVPIVSEFSVCSRIQRTKPFFWNRNFFSCLYSNFEKKCSTLHKKTKEVPEKTKKRKISEQKLKYIIMKNIPKYKLQLVPFECLLLPLNCM